MGWTQGTGNRQQATGNRQQATGNRKCLIQPLSEFNKNVLNNTKYKLNVFLSSTSLLSHSFKAEERTIGNLFPERKSEKVTASPLHHNQFKILF